MTTRDRIVMMVVAVLVVAAGGWLLVVSPERKQAKKYEEQVAAAQSQLSTAQTQLASAKSDQAQYASAYSSVVHLGKAVPASQEVASLVYQLEQVSNRRSVSFNSIASTSSASSPSSSAGSASASASAGFMQMPFTFIFSGDFFSLEHLFHGLTNFTTHTANGSLEVNGRLLTIQSVKLTPEPTSKGSHPKLSGTVTATAYVLPPSQGVTGAATATSPSGATTPAASTAGSSTTPAVARVTP